MEAFIEFRIGELGHTANAYLNSEGTEIEISFAFHLKAYTFKADEFWKALSKIEDRYFENYIKADNWLAKELLKHLNPIKTEEVIV